MDSMSQYFIEGTRPSEIKTKQQGKIAVNIVENIILGELGWIFTHNTIENDYGIDAYIERREVYDNKIAILGEMIALQIKSSVKCDEQDEITFKFNESHKNYWSYHSLPVVIVWVDLSKKECYWELFDEETLEVNEEDVKNKFSIKIPKNQVLGRKFKHKFIEIAYQGKLSKLYKYLTMLELMEVAAADNQRLKAVFNTGFIPQYLGRFVDFDSELEVDEGEVTVLNNSSMIVPFIEEGKYNEKMDPKEALSKYLDWADIENGVNKNSYYIDLKEEFKGVLEVLSGINKHRKILGIGKN